jgi:putative oxidoreductase
MLSALFRTKDEWSLLVLRGMLAVVIFAHGAQKVFGWFGGHGFEATMNGFTVNMHIPWIFALLAILAESLGPAALFIGFLTRIAALGIFVEMIVVIWLVHWQQGFFMNWWGQKKGEGFEYHLLVLAIALALMMAGGGKWSVDGVIAKYLGNEK